MLNHFFKQFCSKIIKRNMHVSHKIYPNYSKNAVIILSSFVGFYIFFGGGPPGPSLIPIIPFKKRGKVFWLTLFLTILSYKYNQY